MILDKWYNITPKIYYKKRPREREIDSRRFVLLRGKKKKKSEPDYFYGTDLEKQGGKGCFCVPLVWFFSLVPTDLSESGASASPLLGSTSD